MWKDRGSAEWCSRENREERQKRWGGKGGGGRRKDMIQRKTGIREIKSSCVRKGGETVRTTGRGVLKVSVRTAWSSELDGDTAAVTSALISPSPG